MPAAKAFISLIVIAIGTLLLTGCESRQVTRGNMPTAYQISQIEIGKDTKADLMAELGSPSFESAADSDYWFYTSQVLQDHPLLGRKLEKQNVLVVQFGDFERVESLRQFEAGTDRIIVPVQTTTNITLREKTLIEQTLGMLFPGLN